MAQKQSAREIQQFYLESFGDRDWDLFTATDYSYLKFKIAYASYGPPLIEGDMSDMSNDPGYTKEQYTKILPIYDKIVSFGKYSANGTNIYISVLFVCLIPKSEEIKTLEFCDGMQLEDINVTPVFKVRKCISAQKLGGCCIFLDNIGREYSTWKRYLEENKLSQGIIIGPRDGRYTGTFVNSSIEVDLEIVISPACSLLAKARVVGDVAGTAVSIGAVGVLGFSLFTPVAAGIAITTGIASLVTGLYGGVSSGATLIDRNQHGQTISLSDPEARGCWINIGASATGIIAGAGSKLLSDAARNGAVIGRGLILTHDAAVLAALISGSAGFVNSLITLITRYQDTGETPSKLELFQMASSILFLTNSLMNNRMASTIITESQNGAIVNYRTTLRSGRHRKMFDKMVAETRRTQGVVQGNSEVIQGINHITNKDQFFQGALRINKNLNEHKVKISIDKSGQALLNAEHAINPETFAASPTADKVAFLQNIGENKITARNVSVNLGMDVKPNCMNPMYIKVVSFAISTAKLIDSFPEFSSSKVEILEAIARRLSGFTEMAYEYFVKIVEEIFSAITITVWERVRALGVQDTELFEKLVCYVLDELKRRALDEKHIPDILKKFFVDGHISYEKIQELFNGFQNVINSEYRKIGYREVRCKLCKGIRFSD